MTNEDVLRLIGRIVVDSEAAAIRIRELEAEVARRTRPKKSNVVKMEPTASKAEAAPKETVEADPVPNQ